MMKVSKLDHRCRNGGSCINLIKLANILQKFIVKHLECTVLKAT